MFPNASSFYGLWQVYSGALALQMLLHEDGSYGQSLWGGAQQVWGQWSLSDYNGQPMLDLAVTGATPSIFLNQFGPGPAVERHAVMNVQANQIQLYDALMVRQFVQAEAPHPFFPAASPHLPPMPIMPPLPAYSAPAPMPAPAVHAAPLLQKFKNGNAAVAQQVAAVQATNYSYQLPDDGSIDDGEAEFQKYKMDEDAKIDKLKQDAIDKSCVQFQLALNGIQTYPVS